MSQYGVEHNRSVKIRLSTVLTSDTKPLVTTRICLTSFSIKSRIETHCRALRRPCPKNQKRCWNSTGSPPPAGSKKVVLKFRSVKTIVMAPANTGRDNSNKNAVIKIDQTNNGNL